MDVRASLIHYGVVDPEGLREFSGRQRRRLGTDVVVRGIWASAWRPDEPGPTSCSTSRRRHASSPLVSARRQRRACKDRRPHRHATKAWSRPIRQALLPETEWIPATCAVGFAYLPPVTLWRRARGTQMQKLAAWSAGDFGACALSLRDLPDLGPISRGAGR